MRAFATGEAGFIGSHLVDRLLENHYEVTILDNFSKGREKNIIPLKGNGRFGHYKGNVSDGRLFVNLLKGKMLSFIWQLLRISAETCCTRMRIENNLVGTINIFDVMIANGVNDLVFASFSNISCQI